MNPPCNSLSLFHVRSVSAMIVKISQQRQQTNQSTATLKSLPLGATTPDVSACFHGIPLFHFRSRWFVREV